MKIPLAIKSKLRWWAVSTTDTLRHTPIARPARHHSMAPMHHSVVLTQPFMPSATLQPKIHNLREAASRINSVVIHPGEIFSFWHTVGNPNNPTRFAEGRSIRAGKTTTDLGGGLCQASGIIHHAALLAGLTVLERHNHSIDLYTDATRFAPLGTDATVFFGFKDLRILNNTPTPINFHLTIEEHQITLTLKSALPITPHELHTSIIYTPEGKEVSLSTTPGGNPICQSTYKNLE